jgi:UDP-N-acetylglucosamine transferase subunit ALG13
MIFVTVGTDQPFDRMVRVIDRWANERGRSDLFAQVGIGGWKPGFPHTELLAPPVFKQRFIDASVIVGHAGMGTILSALHYRKPILVMPKRASLGEHRNEHQLATARRMVEMGSVSVAFDEEELFDRLDHLEEIIPRAPIALCESGPLIEGLREFIHNDRA